MFGLLFWCILSLIITKQIQKTKAVNKKHLYRRKQIQKTKAANKKNICIEENRYKKRKQIQKTKL